MDPEQRMRRQSLRVIISEIIMVITIIIMVAILALIVSGYWLGSDFKVERQGMLQINSIPTGANIAVDGDAPWYQRTNTSKVLASGEHHVVLKKDGYDSWSKTVNINEGLLYRLRYPRLFLLEREKSSIYDTTAVTFASLSKDRNLLLLANNTSSWILLPLDSDKPEPKTVDVSQVFSSVSLAEGATTGLFTGEIISASWDNNNTHILFKINSSLGTEWVLLDVKNPKDSINLTKEFATDFDTVQIFDDSASSLLAIRNGNLHKIDTSSRQISAILAEKVAAFGFYGPNIIYQSGNEISLIKVGDSKVKNVATSDVTAHVFLGRFYDEEYITIVSGDICTIYRKDNLEEVTVKALNFTPENVKVGHDNEFVFMNTGTTVAVLDMETMEVSPWTLGSTHFGWLDDSMVYEVLDGTLSVYDFDGLNHRTLSTNVSERSPVTISNNKWLYYFSDNSLVRERIIE